MKVIDKVELIPQLKKRIKLFEEANDEENANKLRRLLQIILNSPKETAFV